MLSLVENSFSVSVFTPIQENHYSVDDVPLFPKLPASTLTSVSTLLLFLFISVAFFYMFPLVFALLSNQLFKFFSI